MVACCSVCNSFQDKFNVAEQLQQCYSCYNKRKKKKKWVNGAGIGEVGGGQVLANSVSENCCQVSEKSGNFELAQWWCLNLSEILETKCKF